MQQYLGAAQLIHTAVMDSEVRCGQLRFWTPSRKNLQILGRSATGPAILSVLFHAESMPAIVAHLT